jgi:C4-dicarboxylate transporter DctM subunit
MTPVVILGGIYFGIFTTAGAALVTTVYAIAVGAFAYRMPTLRACYDALTEAASSSAIVMPGVAYASLSGGS